MLYYKEIDLPEIPAELLAFDPMDQAITHHAVDQKTFDYGKDHVLNGQVITPPQYLVRMVNYQKLTNWLNQYIPEIPNVVLSEVVPTDSGKMIVHTDIKRIATLNYMIDTGGDNVVTSWYREDNQNIIRKEKPPGNQTDSGYVDYDRLELLDSVVFQKNRWYLLRTNVLHDVSHISSVRRYLGVSYFSQQSLDYFDF